MAYAQPVLLDIKKGVAAQLGKTDYATPSLVRDISINKARSEFYSFTDWSFRRKETKLTFSLSAASDYTNGLGVAALPTLCAPHDDPVTIWEYPVQGQPPVTYTQVGLSDVAKYSLNNSSRKVYALDNESFQFVSNQTTATPFITYLQMPADRALDGTDDAVAEPCSFAGLKAIILLATAEYWLAAERDEDEYDRFFSRYLKARDVANDRDSRLGPVVTVKPALYGRNMGFNRQR